MLFLAVELGGGFGAAAATVISTTDVSMQVEIDVEVASSAESVVAHLALPGEPTMTVPLLPRGDGTYGITTELRLADYTVVFEMLGEVSLQSQPVSLSAMGAELGPELFDDGTTSTEPGFSAETQGWLWLAVAFAATSLSVLALWVLGGRNEAEGEDRSAVDSEP